MPTVIEMLMFGGVLGLNRTPMDVMRTLKCDIGVKLVRGRECL